MAMDHEQFLEKFALNSLSLFLFLSFLIFIYKWLCRTNATTKNKPPSPRKLPVFGNLHQLGKLPHRSLLTLSQQYGDLMLLHIDSKPTLVASSPDMAREIMKTHDVIFANRPNLKVARRILYDCKDLAFANYGEYWRQMKSICVLHVLSSKKVRSFRQVREEEAAVMVDKIRRFRQSSEEVNLSEIIASLTKDVICRAAFGRKYTGEEGCANIRELLNDFSEALGAFCMQDFVPWLGWIDRLTGVDRKANKVANALDGFIEKIVQEHVERLNLQTDSTDEADKEEKLQDFVDILLEIQRENSSVLPRESIKAILMDMLAAGTDTTYTLLEWAMAELLQHPQVMKELQEEVRVSNRGKQGINEDDVKNMKYLKAVIKETLRLHPPLPLLLFRESSQDVKINGYDIAAGTQVIINAWAIQRDSTSWEDAEEFRPERFLNSSIDFKGQDFEFIPFGAGRRGCPGISFGIVDAELVLATLAYEFDWMIPQGKDFNLVESMGTTIRKRDALVAIPTPYSN
ncbi:cytochrome P450 71A22-like [Spinacia oleracea]|uniref:Cytochrome P450 71A22-like n=1 Tax=Spinacia oleracea TaxID=3562 RepID=A0A9R0JBF4_SPIOL|nr:cytochrome P450 71A22-like [Spinacia oleracea]